MKKRLILALSALSLCILAGCASINITINKKGNLLQDLEKVNTFANIYDKYGSFRIDVFGTHADGTKDDYSVYYGDNTYVNINKYGTNIDDHGDVYGYDTESDYYFRYVFPGDSYELYKNDNEMTACFRYDDEEKIISREDRDGKICLCTDSKTKNLRQLLESWGFDPDTVDRVISEYIIDSDTLVIEDIKTYAVINGEKILYSDTVMNLDSDDFVPDKGITEAITSDDKRTVTVIADPGTADEKVYSDTIIKGGLFFVQYPTGYENTLYDDSECTIPHEISSDRDSDLTVYIKRSGD